MKLKLGMAALLVAGTLNGCSVFSPVEAQDVTTYRLDQLPHTPQKHARRAINLLVTQPWASSVYNTTAMAYTDEPHELGYFVKSAWVESPSLMLQGLMIQTLQNTHYFRNVGTSSYTTDYDYILNSQIMKFEQVFHGSSSVVHFNLRVQLVNARMNVIVATHAYDQTVDGGSSPESGVQALNLAVAQTLQQLAFFCLGEL